MGDPFDQLHPTMPNLDLMGDDATRSNDAPTGGTLRGSRPEWWAVVLMEEETAGCAVPGVFSVAESA